MKSSEAICGLDRPAAPRAKNLAFARGQTQLIEWVGGEGRRERQYRDALATGELLHLPDEWHGTQSAGDGEGPREGVGRPLTVADSPSRNRL